jgi:outer membrane protein, heavy metal efflux system
MFRGSSRWDVLIRRAPAWVGLLTGCSVCWVTPVAGDSGTNVVPLNLSVFSDYAGQARLHHPALQAARERRISAEAARAGVRTFADPTVKANVMVSSSRGPRDSEDGNLGYGVEQRLPWLGKERASQALATAEAAGATVAEEVRFQEIRRDVVDALLQLARSGQELALAREDNDWHAVEARTSRARYEAGSGPSLDVLRFESEHAQRRTMLLRLEQEVSAKRAAANRALGQPPETPLPGFQLPESISPPVYSATLATRAIEHAPAVRLGESARRRAERQVEVARKSGRPDISVGFDSAHYSGDGGWRQGLVSVSSTLPWFNRDRYRQDVARDQAMVRAAVSELEDSRQAVQSGLFRWATAAATAAAEAQNQQREVLPRAEAAFQSALNGWIGGGATLSELFETRRAVIESRNRIVTAITEEWEAINEMAYLCGTDLSEVLASEPPPGTPSPETTNANANPNPARK